MWDFLISFTLCFFLTSRTFLTRLEKEGINKVRDIYFCYFKNGTKGMLIKQNSAISRNYNSCFHKLHPVYVDMTKL
jgi:predicted permease